MPKTMTCPQTKIIGEKANLDALLAEAGKAFHDTYKTSPDFPDYWHMIRKSQEQVMKLSSGGDCFYDLPTIGFVYSLWYHPKRFNQWINHILNTLYEWEKCESRSDCLDIYDVGGGTGAVLWAWIMAIWARKQCNLDCPRTVNYSLIDNSAFMAEYARLLWQNLESKYRSNIQVGFRASVPQLVSSQGCKRLLYMSYFFDHSDAQDVPKAKGAFASIKSRILPNQIYISTSGRKIDFVKLVADQENGNKITQLLNGELTKVRDLRKSINTAIFKGKPEWTENDEQSAIINI